MTAVLEWTHTPGGPSADGSHRGDYRIWSDRLTDLFSRQTALFVGRLKRVPGPRWGEVLRKNNSITALYSISTHRKH